MHEFLTVKWIALCSTLNDSCHYNVSHDRSHINFITTIFSFSVSKHFSIAKNVCSINVCCEHTLSCVCVSGNTFKNVIGNLQLFTCINHCKNKNIQ